MLINMQNPLVTVKDYCDYFMVSVRTAIRYRNSDKRLLKVERIRLNDWLLINSTPPPYYQDKAKKCQ